MTQKKAVTAREMVDRRIQDLDLNWITPILLRDRGELFAEADSCARAIQEYKKFLHLLIAFGHVRLGPSVVVDEVCAHTEPQSHRKIVEPRQVWHAHVLNTRQYTIDCKKIAGTYLHHYPNYEKPHSFHVPGFINTREKYTAVFGDVPDDCQFVWNKMSSSGTYIRFSGKIVD